MRRISVSQLIFLMAVIVGLALMAQPTVAAEPICPGGDNERTDIVWCADFEKYDDPSCVTGNEEPCARANNLVRGSSYDYLIQGGDAAVGSGAIVGVSVPGGTGPGYSSASLPVPTAAVSYRFYVKFSNGYLQSSWSSGNHGPSIEAVGKNCAMRATLDWYSEGARFKVQGPCSPTYDLPNNIANMILQNNRWYLVELRFIMDTACTGTGNFDCNGIGQAWIDGQKVMEHVNLNLGGTSNNALFVSVWAARSYYGLGTPAWEQSILYDNFVVSNTGIPIGPATSENPRGTPDPQSPYANFTAYNGMMGHKLGSDCSTDSGYLNYVSSGLSNQWRDGGTLQGTITHGAYQDDCTADQDKALKISLGSSDTGGGASHPFVAAPFLAIHGQVYLPASNDYTQASPLTGYTKYGWPEQNWSNYIAMSVVNGQWALVQRVNGGSQNVIATADSVLFNAWHEFELVIESNNTVSLMINKNQVIQKTPIPTPIDWAWSNVSTPGPRYMILGIIDFQGEAPFTVYYDDVDLGTASFWSCDGWHESSCPFRDAEANTTTPAAPTDLRPIG